MVSLALILGITSGFILGGFRESPANLIMTSLAVDAALAPVTTIIAIQRRRSPIAWAVLGFALGLWALGWILLFGRRQPDSKIDDSPTTPEAA
jgi:hypothetical protein